MEDRFLMKIYLSKSQDKSFRLQIWVAEVHCKYVWSRFIGFSYHDFLNLEALQLTGEPLRLNKNEVNF